MELKTDDFKIGQQVGVLWRRRNEEKVWYTFKKSKISKLSMTNKGTTVYLKPQLFTVNYKIEDDEYEDYREIPEGGLLMVNTPMLISDKTSKYFEEVAKRWNENPPKSIWE